MCWLRGFKKEKKHFFSLPHSPLLLFYRKLRSVTNIVILVVISTEYKTTFPVVARVPHNQIACSPCGVSHSPLALCLRCSLSNLSPAPVKQSLYFLIFLDSYVEAREPTSNHYHRFSWFLATGAEGHEGLGVSYQAPPSVYIELNCFRSSFLRYFPQHYGCDIAPSPGRYTMEVVPECVNTICPRKCVVRSGGAMICIGLDVIVSTAV